MKNKLICAVLLMSFLIGSSIVAVRGLPEVSASEKSDGFGNMPSVILNGGLSADKGNDIVYADSEDEGKLYIRNTKTDKSEKLSDNSASYINVLENKIYYVSQSDGKFKIILNFIGFSEKVLYESFNEISHLYVSSEGMYYLEDSKVYFNDFENDSVSVVYENNKMYAFVPMENGDICWLEKKEDYVEVASYPKQFEGTEEREIDFYCHRYNPNNGSVTDVNYGTVITQSSSSKPDAATLKSLKLSAVIGGKKIPTEEYPNDAKFTDTGLPCNDHKTGVCGHETEEMCNCKAFYNGTPLHAVQCYGYARYLYLYLFGHVGYPGSSKNFVLGSLPEGTVTIEAFKDLFANAKPGAQMRVTYLKPDGVTISNHSLIILDWNEVGFSACEGNLDGGCGAYVRRRAYADYVPCLISVDFFHMPKNYPEQVESTTELSDTSTSTVASSSTTETTQEGETENREGGLITRFFRSIGDFFVKCYYFFKDLFDFSN